MLSTVLVVDDDPIHRSLLERIVTRLGYKVQLAASGEEAHRQVGSGVGSYAVRAAVDGDARDCAGHEVAALLVLRSRGKQSGRGQGSGSPSRIH